MGTIDRPGSPDDGTVRPGPPELVRVGRSDGWRPAIGAVVVVSVLLAVAVWKPWEAGSGSAVARSTIPPDAAGGLVPAVTEHPGESGAFAPTPLPPAPTFAGLDLSVMGTTDPHDAWGVAVGYVSQTQFDIAAHSDRIVTPVVSWQRIEPGHALPGPVLDHPAVTSVAIAATWPGGTRPVAVRLVSFGAAGPRAAGSPGLDGTDVPLGDWLGDLVGTVPGATPPPAIGSGRFYIPFVVPEDVVAWPGEGWPASWPTHGWARRSYAFEMVLDGGQTVRLPFVIGAGTGS
jgi:hypothetical protein